MFGATLMKLGGGAVAIMVGLACIHSSSPPPVPVAVGQGYDIGTDLKLMEAVRTAFQQSPAFAFTEASKPGLLFVTQLTNSRLETVGGRERVHYSIGFYADRQQIGAAGGECWMDDLAACATEIVKTAQVVGARILSRPGGT